MCCLLQVVSSIQGMRAIVKGDAQFISEPVERAREARLDRPAGTVQRFGRLRFRESEEVAAGDDEPFLVAQIVDSVEQCLLPFTGQRCDLRRRFALRSVVRCRPKDEIRASPSRLATIPRLVDDDLQQPGPKRGAGSKTAQREIRLDERLLCRILGLARRAGHDPGGSDGEILIAANELFEGGDIPGSGSLDER